MTPPVTVALVGNPNAGKSTLFNALSGLRQHVGNYPGVTVEMKTGRFTDTGTTFELIDLPGTYSLAPRSPDEMVAVDLLLGRRSEHARPDVVLAVVDASNLDRHLYLATQVMELGVPVVLAVNMLDVAAAQGITLDLPGLARETGLRVVGTRANRGTGLAELKAALREAVGEKTTAAGPPLPEVIDREAAAIGDALGGDVPPFLVRRLLLDVGGSTEQGFVGRHDGLARKLQDARDRLAAAGHPVPAAEAKARYAWIRAVTAKVVRKPATRPVTGTDRLDRVLTHRVWGTLVFLAVMFAVFQSIFVLAQPAMDAIDGAAKWLADAVGGVMDPGPLRSLVTDGVIIGVGGVVKFLPQILILFLFIAVLEDCGYMARAAFLMDRLMSRCGLSGKSFIPLLSSVACAVPGIMAARVIENRRDRLATVVVAPLMSCSARLPVYTLLIAAFLEDGYPWWLPGLTMFGLYMIGFTVAPLVALVLKRTLLRGSPPLFVMELPTYKRPSLGAVLRRMADAGGAFLRRAGTLILAAMILVWALLYFPDKDANGGSYPARVDELVAKAAAADKKIGERFPPAAVAGPGAIAVEIEPHAAEKDEAEKEANRLTAEWKGNSFLGRAGRALEPAFRPLGWDWRIGMAVLASFPAREVIVGTLGIIYEAGDAEADPERATLREAVRKEWAADPVRGKYGVSVALSVLVFFALCCQCASTLAVIRRETGGWAWPAFTFVYMTTLAYVAGFAVFQIGRVVTDLVG